MRDKLTAPVGAVSIAVKVLNTMPHWLKTHRKPGYSHLIHMRLEIQLTERDLKWNIPERKV